jgi:transcriptional regulator with XRE-family HTH domain
VGKEEPLKRLRVSAYQKGGNKVYLSQNLKYLREQKGINQCELSEHLGLTQSAIGNWEIGNRTPDIEMIVKLSEYFSVSLDELVLIDLRPPMPMYSGNLRYLRKKYGMSQDDIGNLLGVSQKCVSKYEMGSREPSIEKLMKIADYFGISLDQLVKQDLSAGGD